MWNDYSLVVQMPHMAPGEKLSEVEFLKVLAAYQWESIARALGRRPSQIVADHKERLYGSVIDVEVNLCHRHSPEILGEDANIFVMNQVRFFAKKFVEGLFIIDDEPISKSVLTSIKSRADLEASGLSWACMTNAFIARTGGNVRLKVFRPEGADDVSVEELSETPLGITRQGKAQETGYLTPFDGEGPLIPLEPTSKGPIIYPIVPESDLNGAGLVYFARYEAMMNYGERRFLCERMDPPFSAELVSYLSMEHRKAFFFANTTADDQVEVRLSAQLIPPGSFEPPPMPRYRTPLKLQFRIDLYRGTDKMLMASSLVRKALNIPGNAKAAQNEAERLLRRLGASS